MQYIPALDGLRGLCVLAVLLFHNSVLSPQAFPNGQGYGLGGFLGVSIFFVLSGYLITALMLEEVERTGTLSFMRFFARRFVRLYPALLVSVAWTALLWPILRPSASLARVVPAVLLQYLNWIVVFENFASVDPFGPCWSLAVEWQFYLLWPCVMWLLWSRLAWRAGALAVLLAMLVAAALVRHRLQAAGSIWVRYPSSLTHVDALIAGAASACAATLGTGRRLLSQLPDAVVELLSWGMLLALGVMFHVCRLEQARWLIAWGYSMVAAFGALVVARVAAAPQSRLARVLAFGPLVAIGKRAYGIYLYNLPLLFLLLPHRAAWGSGHIASNSALFVLGSLGLGWLSYDYVEQPTQRLYRRRVRRKGRHEVRAK